MKYFRFRSTNYFLLPSARDDGLLAFDVGWPCSLHGYAKALKTTGFRFAQIRWAMVSHFHIDHAGLVRDFQDAGVTCLVFECQSGAIDAMEELAVRKYPAYRKILKEKLMRLGTADSRGFLESIGIQAEVAVTAGHSDDSVTLITDNGEALIGDLSPLSQLMPDDLNSHNCYELIRTKGAKNIYPSHAEPFSLE
jgi:glyoxylase-like metal-dependent hydrolase (beta-lactamase superfamily II)